MTKNQFKNSLNAELNAAGINRQIKKVDQIGANTVLIFKDCYDMKTLKWLNDRFQNGISITNTDHSIVFINTPLQDKKEI